MSAPKTWVSHGKGGDTVSVDTPNTIRARELKDLYQSLNLPLLSVDERLQILLHVKYTVKVSKTLIEIRSRTLAHRAFVLRI